MCDRNKTDAPDPGSQMREKLYAEAAHIRDQQAKQQSSTAEIGSGYMRHRAESPGRPRLNERVGDALYRSAQESRKYEQLGELAKLLAANPDTARILELIEATGV